MKELQKYYSDIPEMIDLVRKCLQVTNSLLPYNVAIKFQKQSLKVYSQVCSTF